MILQLVLSYQAHTGFVSPFERFDFIFMHMIFIVYSPSTCFLSHLAYSTMCVALVVDWPWWNDIQRFVKFYTEYLNLSTYYQIFHVSDIEFTQDFSLYDISSQR